MNTVLFAENDADFLDVRAEVLEKAGYRVLKAHSLADAETLLRDAHIHLAIVDIRMINDDDERDRSGLTLAKDPAFRSIPKIILTSRPSYQYVREAMGPIEDGLPPAVDFLSKEEGPEAMIEAVRVVLAHHVRINWDLMVHWWNDQGPLSFAYLTCLIEPGVDRTHLPDRVSEVEDLFRNLFYDYDQVTFSQLLWRKGGRAGLEVYAHSEGKEDRFVVTYGQIQDIRTEQKHRAQFAPQTLDATGPITKFTAETRHFGATASVIGETGSEEIQPFAAFYRENSHRQIHSTLEHLFQTTLAPWHQQGCFVEEGKELPQAYRERLGLCEDILPAMELGRKIQALAKEAFASSTANITFTPDRLVIRFSNNRTLSCPDPVLYLYHNDDMFSASHIVCRTTPGGLDVDTILVDRAGRTWLTDFIQAGPTPIWHDFVSLEAAVRFRLMEVGDLQTLYGFERQLLATRSLSDTIALASVEPEHRKALDAIQTIRHLAADMAWDDPEPYYISLLFCTMAGFAAYDPALKRTGAEAARLLHRLLLVTLLCEKIDQTKQETSLASATSPAARDLRMDVVEHQVWVGDRQVSLTNTEFDLLLYLYRHAGELCERSDIMRQVFDLEDASLDDEGSLINTNIGRLRNKIERDPGAPRYIVTIRGKGYRLILQPE
jgi:DNA-binding response OmpR family regulator